MQVAPVSEILSHIPHRIPQVLINRDPVPHVMDKVDIVLLGDCDEVLAWIEKQLASRSPTSSSHPSADISLKSAKPPTSPTLPSLQPPNNELSPHIDGGQPAYSPMSQEEQSWKGKEPELALEGIENLWCFDGANKEHPWLSKMRELLYEEPNDEDTT